MKGYLDRVAEIFHSVLIACCLAFLLAPLAVTVLISLNESQVMSSILPRTYSLRWYTILFNDNYVLSGLKTSLILAAVTSILVTCLSLGAAVALYRSPPKVRFLVETGLSFPLLMPHVVLGFGLLLALSIAGVDNTLVRLALGHLIVSIPYGVRAVFGAIFGVRRNLMDAAASLGANERRGVFDILLPLAKPGIFASLTMTFALSLEDVTVSIFLVDARNYTFSVALFNSMRNSFNPEIAAASVILVTISAIAVVMLQRFIGLQRITDFGGSTKG